MTCWTLCQKVDMNNGGGRAYRGFCMGYIKGVAEVLSYDKKIYLPFGVTNGQMYDAVMNWLSRNPERRNLSPLDVIYLALKQVYPPSGAAKQ